MKIAITSGKGGVGKTLVATCLARLLARYQTLQFIDCDVEAPNAHLFLQPLEVQSEEQFIPTISGVDPDKCVYCGDCARVCYFNALTVGKSSAMAFPELCRWCLACQEICQHDALLVDQRHIGASFRGQIDSINLYWSTLAPGAGGMTVRLIEQLITRISPRELAILDSPPGTSCAVVHTIRNADRVVLVCDPTRFGWHDLKLSVHLCRSLSIEPLVLINRADIGDLAGLRQWCQDNALTVIGELPDDRRIAELYSRGIIPLDEVPGLNTTFEAIANKILTEPRSDNLIDEQTSRRQEAELFYPLNDSSLTNIEPSNKSHSSPMEIVVISGKGGTGKTSLAACFAQLGQATLADCDVDAADMHLLMEPQVIHSDVFTGGRVMAIVPELCVRCGKCAEICQWQAVRGGDGPQSPWIDEQECEGCGACLLVCPKGAIAEHHVDNGRWYWSQIRLGFMSHATLEPGQENSGKLVTLVRRHAAEKMPARNIDKPIILDGSPGTGCPVIASVGGTRLAVIVTEPTVSGCHDLQRILELTGHFKVPSGVIINKADLNHAISQTIRAETLKRGAVLLGELPYDTIVIDAQQAGRTILEYAPDSVIAGQIQSIWTAIIDQIGLKNSTDPNEYCSTIQNKD